MRTAHLLFAAMAVTSGCALMTPAQVETHKQVLAKVPAELPPARNRSAVILVLVPEAKPLYDTTEMAYMTKPYEVEYFAKNEWGEKPAQMIHSLIVKTLRDGGYFKEVLTSSQPGPHKYVLRSELLELQQDFTSAAPRVRLALRFQLVDGATSRVLASRELAASEPMREKSPQAGVVAANDAVAKVLRDLASFVVETAG